MYRRHTPSLYRLAMRMTGGRVATAEDVVQEAWTRATTGLPSFERRSSLATWLRAITLRCALERIRADVRAGEPMPGTDLEGAPTVEPAIRLDLERAFEALPTGYRAVLVMHDIEGYRHDEIARLLGVSPGTSKSQLSRARAWMRRALGDER
jgi:RNA polymerase sigma-70 factor (ECF subfamily)